MAKLYYKDKPIVGLDISQTGAKMMAVDPRRGRILGYGSLDYDPVKMQAVFESDDNSYLAENLQNLVTNKVVGSLPSNHVAIGIPTARTFLRTFSLPRDQEDNIADAVEVEVVQYIPIPSSALYVDYSVIERKKDSLTIIMSAVPRAVVDNCTAAAWSAGLRPVLVEPSVSAIARALSKSEKVSELTSLLIDIGTTSTDIAVIENNALRVTGGAAIGSNTFTVAISEAFETTLENAHQMKILNGLNSGPRQEKIRAALQPHLNRIITEVHKVIRYYSERLDESKDIEQVIIVGGGSDVPGLGDFFTDTLVMPARVASPLREIDFGKLPHPAKQFQPRYITVEGLANLPMEVV